MARIVFTPPGPAVCIKEVVAGGMQGSKAQAAGTLGSPVRRAAHQERYTRGRSSSAGARRIPASPRPQANEQKQVIRQQAIAIHGCGFRSRRSFWKIAQDSPWRMPSSTGESRMAGILCQLAAVRIARGQSRSSSASMPATRTPVSQKEHGMHGKARSSGIGAMTIMAAIW